MDFQLEEKGPLLRRVELAVSGAQVGNEENKAYAKLRRSAKVPGFRSGKVPNSVLRQMYGKQVRADAVQALITEGMEEVLGELDVAVIHLSPVQLTEQRTEDGGFVAAFELELRPEIEAQGYLGLELEQPRVDVSDEEVEEQLTNLQQQLATFEPIEERTSPRSGDHVSLDVQGIGKASELEAREQMIELGSGQGLEGLEAALEGAQLGEAFELSTQLPPYFPPAERLAGQRVKLLVTPRSIQKKVVPEIDDELARESGEADTLDELRTRIRERLAETRRAARSARLREQAIDRLIAAHPFDLPEQYVEARTQRQIKQQLQMMLQQGLLGSFDEQTFDQLQASLKERVRRDTTSEFLLDAVADAEEISVDEQDVRAYIQREAQENGMPFAQLMRIYNDPQVREGLRSEVRRQRALDLVIEHARITEVEPQEAAPRDAEDAATRDAEDAAAGQMQEAESPSDASA